jgi:hypothetical protein
VWVTFLLQIRRPVQVKGDGRLSFVAVCVDNETWAAAVTSKEPLLSKASGARLTRKRREYSSGGHQQLGSISKQGNRFMRMLLVEAAQGAVRCDPGFRNEYLHRCHRKPKGVAKVAAARKLAIRLYWMLRTNTGYPEVVRVESSSRVPLVVRHADRPKG